MGTPADEIDMNDHDTERLCAGYRATVQDPPYDAADAALMRAATRRTRRLPMRRMAYGVAATLLAAFGLAAGMRSLTFSRRPSSGETPTAASQEGHASQGRTTAFNDYLTDAVLSSASTEHRRDTGFLQETSALSPLRADLTCGTAAEIDLNAPGALASLKVRRPGDYVRIMRIIAGVTRHPELDVARWISATFHAGNVSYVPLWLTSLPPQRRLSFCLESTSYSVVLTITSNGARVSPTDYYKNARRPLRMR